MRASIVALMLGAMAIGCAQAEDSPHLIGGSVGYGSLEFEHRNSQLYDGGDGATMDIWYRYMFSEHWGAELSYMGGESGIISAIFDSISNISDLRYHGGRVSVYGELPLYRRGGLYAKAGYGSYNVRYDLDDVGQDTSDQGFVGSLGFQHRFNSGLGLHVEYQRLSLDKLTGDSFNFGLSWRF
ncbi:porin family protein [Shewanella corallii]|uniref:Porin family protein n=1 Tax=Shewanella corallii TaxID=560080 RepID=A0ABT0NCA1_9GAMM|nr:porin family protein [Shewanella corallii]